MNNEKELQELAKKSTYGFAALNFTRRQRRTCAKCWSRVRNLDSCTLGWMKFWVGLIVG